MIAIYSFGFSTILFIGFLALVLLNIAIFVFNKNTIVVKIVDVVVDTMLGDLLDLILDDEESPYERAGVFFLFEFFYISMGILATVLAAFAWPFVILYGGIVLMLKRKQ